MGKYFGTDGVRGIANQELTPELAYQIGRCGGFILTGNVQRPVVVIGRDTRISGQMLESAIIAGLLSIGANVIRLGVVSTPAVAYLTKKLRCNAGIMISASHNPVEDNGIKFFGSDGFKLLDETEIEIEKLMDMSQDSLPRPVGHLIGSVSDDFDAKQAYINELKSIIKVSFQGCKIVMDCANGAAYELAPQVFRELGAEVITIGAEPNGLNINDNCGSTHPGHLQEEVVRHHAMLGLAYDGDADRLIAVDELGHEVDGDYLLAICGLAMNQSGKLKHNTIVTTVMANLGFFKGVERAGLKAVKTAVGDRYVMEEMRRGGYNFGGEQSGHVIFLDHSSSGDGILTSLYLLQTLVKIGKPLSQLKEIIEKYPQVLVNVRVGDKNKLNGNQAIEEAIYHATNELGDQGRVLVRPSGTESLIRVMAEGPDREHIEKLVHSIVKVIQKELN
jgi:phosphoglucosamine mutase